ncbi:MAG TPA: hypothetical protein VEW28_10235 [Candidatus Kapabacteria bacterium]|nr:hypothetical protein [Candidatus Kapabacteria bacterium]
MKNTDRSYRSLSRTIIALALVLLVVQCIDYINFTVDDVFISLRIAVNGAAGHGFVYNPGDIVEGHSDPLWVGMLSLVVRSGVINMRDPLSLVWAARALSVVFGFSTIAAVYILAKRIFIDSQARSLYASLTVLALVVCSAFVLWTVGALEMTLVALCYSVVAIVLYDLFDKPDTSGVSKSFAIGLAFAFASLTRPEPPIVAAVIFIYLLYTLPKKKQFIILCIVPYIIIMIGFEWWRWGTYHDLLPNTFYAKTGGGIASIGMGLKYTFECIGGIGSVLLVFIPLAFNTDEKLKKIRMAMLLMIGAVLFFSIYSSGDWMPGFRFFIPIAPLIVLLEVMGLKNVLTRFLQRDTILFNPKNLLVAVVLISLSTVLMMRVLLHSQLQLAAGGFPTGFKSMPGISTIDHKDEADWLRAHSKPGDLFATGEAGLIGYLNPDLVLLDLQGLMDKKIAHDRKIGASFDRDYVFVRAPRFVFINRSREAITTNDFYTQLYNDPRFIEQYEKAEHIGTTDIFIRRDSTLR